MNTSKKSSASIGTENANQFFDAIEEATGTEIPKEYKKNLLEKFNSIVNYHPKIGVFGKTGAGKSSLCNALFGQDICKVSDIAACTREPQEVLLGLGSKGMTLLDVPGVGESEARDDEYEALYRSLVPELDIILWVIKADDRAFSSDERFYKKIIKPNLHSKFPFFVVINQVDKIEPFREWDEKNHAPGAKQVKNIEEKRKSVAGFLEIPLSQVTAVSAVENYGLLELVDSIIYALPSEKKISVLKQVTSENRSESAQKDAEKGLWDSIVETAKDLYESDIVQGTIKVAKEVMVKAIITGVAKLAGKLKFW